MYLIQKLHTLYIHVIQWLYDTLLHSTYYLLSSTEREMFYASIRCVSVSHIHGCVTARATCWWCDQLVLVTLRTMDWLHSGKEQHTRVPRGGPHGGYRLGRRSFLTELSLILGGEGDSLQQQLSGHHDSHQAGWQRLLECRATEAVGVLRASSGASGEGKKPMRGNKVTRDR